MNEYSNIPRLKTKTWNHFYIYCLKYFITGELYIRDLHVPSITDNEGVLEEAQRSVNIYYSDNESSSDSSSGN